MSTAQERGHPYEDLNKDGKLELDEVKKQWTEWYDAVRPPPPPPPNPRAGAPPHLAHSRCT